MNRKTKCIICGIAALTLLMAVSALQNGQNPTPLHTVRPVSAITQEHRALPPPKPVPTPVGEETTNVEPDSTQLTEMDFEPPKSNDRPAISTSKEPPRDKPTPEPVPLKNTETASGGSVKMTLTNIEKETILNFNEGEEVASLYTYNQKLQRRFDALAAEFPELVSRKTNSCGAVTYELSKKMIVLKIQKPLSEKEQQRRREYGKAHGIHAQTQR